MRAGAPRRYIPFFISRRPSENQLLRLATAQGDQKASALAVHVQATFGLSGRFQKRPALLQRSKRQSRPEKRTFSNSACGSSVSERQSQDMSAMVISGTYQQPHSHDFASFPRPVCDGEAGAFLRRAFLPIDTATSRQNKAEPAAMPFASSATF